MSHSLTALRKRRSVAVALAGVTVLAGAALVASPAQAATITLIPDQVNQSETRSGGHNDFLADGVRVHTDSNTTNDKAAGYFAVDQDLADVGEPSMNTVRNDPTTTLRPGMQLVTDFDGNGSPDGILVGEPTYSDGSPLYGDNWWLSNGSAQFAKDGAPSHGGGFGSNNNGTLAQWRVAFPNAHVVAFGWSVGSGVKADDTINSMTLGADTYKFRNNGAPVALDVSGSGPYGEVVSVQLHGIDPEHGPVTYTAARSTKGTVRLRHGSDTLTFRGKYNFGGTTSFAYTVKDAQGLTDTGTVTITINPAPSTMTLSGRSTNSPGRAIVAGQIKTVANTRGGVITVKEGGVTVATAVANSKSFRIPIGPGVPAGPHTYDVTFAGSPSAGPASASETLTVR
jgi:hypothetical protein